MRAAQFMKIWGRVLLCSVIISCSICVNVSLAQEGGRAGMFLRLGAGGRALGLGGAFVAAANDVTAGYWNPAGLHHLTAPQFSGMYSLMAFERQYNYVALAYPFTKLGAISLSWINYRVGDIEKRDRDGLVTGGFSDNENAFLISYGKALLPFFALGGTFKLLRHDLAGRSASGLGFDAGLQLKPWDFLALGISAQNLQTHIRWNHADKAKEIFPLRKRVGAQISPLSFLHLGVDYEMSTPQAGRLHAGGEIYFNQMAGLRMGYNHGKMTFGASLMKVTSTKNIEFDYSLVQDPISHGSIHQFSVLLQFNKAPSPVISNGVAPSNPPRQQTTVKEKTPRSNFRIAAPEVSDSIYLVEVIEIRPEYIIVASNHLIGLQTNSSLKLYKSMQGKETGRPYGAGVVAEVRPPYAVIQMHKEKSRSRIIVGEKLLLKVMQ